MLSYWVNSDSLSKEILLNRRARYWMMRGRKRALDFLLERPKYPVSRERVGGSNYCT